VSQDYKTTLNLPATEFPMRGDLPKREPAFWRGGKSRALPAAARQRRRPPAVRAARRPAVRQRRIHLGHAVNKILKDIIVKSRYLAGFDAPYVPGWDCHGLPIEIAVEKKWGKVGTKLDAVEFRQKCREFAEEQINIQRVDFKRLGVTGDWDNPYKTLSFASKPTRSVRWPRSWPTATWCAAPSRCTGASTAARRWPRPRSSTRTRNRRRSTWPTPRAMRRPSARRSA
jgi:isoleucyl-tRNA synthetase